MDNIFQDEKRISMSLHDARLTIAEPQSRPSSWLRLSRKLSYRSLVYSFLLTLVLWLQLRSHYRPTIGHYKPSTAHYYPDHIHNTSFDLEAARPSTRFTDLFNDHLQQEIPDNGRQPLANPSATSRTYSPYPKYNSWSWRRKWQGKHQTCAGPLGEEVNPHAQDHLMAYRLQEPMSNPSPHFGSYHESGLDADHCFDSKGRLGIYRYEQAALPNATSPEPDLDWGKLQDVCVVRNRDRYCERPSDFEHSEWFKVPKDLAPGTQTDSGTKNDVKNSKGKHCKKRAAVLLRTYQGLQYTEEMFTHVRAMVMELSLHSGGEYSVYNLVEIKDPIFASRLLQDPILYNQAMESYVPGEMHNMSLLWSVDSLTRHWYPKTNQSRSQQDHMLQPTQLFSLLHPEFDHVWQMELDARFTANWYNLLENADAWARAQPRKLLSERNSRFYMPYLHGSWDNLTQVIEDETFPSGGNWGPAQNTSIFIDPVGPEPPVADPKDDDYEWGVGEDADLLAFAPIMKSPYKPTDHKFSIYQGFPDVRAPEYYYLDTIVMVRLSRQLLRVMHEAEVEHGVDAVPELKCGMFAHLHGLKMVSYPLPTYYDPVPGMIDDPEELEELFNAQEPEETIWREGRDEYSEAHVDRLTWWNSDANYAPELYRRWIDGSEEGGPERLCLPGILMHPIKGIDFERYE